MTAKKKEEQLYSCEELVKQVMKKFKLGHQPFEQKDGFTVEALCYNCMLEIVKGNGQKHVQISCDDEGNGFHTLFYSFTSNPEEIDAYDYHDKVNKKNIVLLG